MKRFAIALIVTLAGCAEGGPVLDPFAAINDPYTYSPLAPTYQRLDAQRRLATTAAELEERLERNREYREAERRCEYDAERAALEVPEAERSERRFAVLKACVEALPERY